MDWNNVAMRGVALKTLKGIIIADLYSCMRSVKKRFAYYIISYREFQFGSFLISCCQFAIVLDTS